MGNMCGTLVDLQDQIHATCGPHAKCVEMIPDPLANTTATLCPCNNANYLIHERILHIYRSCIHFSIRTDGQLRFTDGELVYHLYRPYRWTRFLGATLCPCNSANYLIHERILHIYRSCIHFSIRTDGQLRFTDGELV